jgi:hypothetical protein
VSKGTGVSFAMSKASRLCQWKTASLLYQDDWSAVKAVTGDWILCHDHRTGWDTPGVQIITEWWKVIEAGEAPVFLEISRQDGHTEVALGGLVTCITLDHTWTITSMMWEHLKSGWVGAPEELIRKVKMDCDRQVVLESGGYRSAT